MLNINELEQRWLRYKIKSYIPHAVISISLLLIVAIALILFSKEEIKPLNNDILVVNTSSIKVKTTPIKVEEKLATPIATKVVKPTQKTTIQQIEKRYSQTPIKKTNNQNGKMTISPSLDFMKKMQGNTLSNYEYQTSSYATTQHKKTEQKKILIEKEKSKQKEIALVEKKPEIIEVKKSAISIKRQNTHDDISQVIGRFNKNNNPALSLFIAKKYYELGDYRKAYNYALITNEINSEIEASWIVFAKSLVKLQEKEQAIKMLKKYINHSSSNRANILLDDITSGKFK